MRKTLWIQLGSDLLKKYIIFFRFYLTKAELLALTWDDIDYAKKVIHIRRTMVYLPGENGMCFKLQTPKTKKSLRDIPLLDNVAKVLRRHSIEQKKQMIKLGNKWQPIDKEGFRNLVFYHRIWYTI